MLSFLAAGLLTSCDDARRKALRALEAEGVEVSGRFLSKAVRNGDARVAGLLLTAGVHCGHADDRGRTPLRMAAEQGDLAIAAMLLQNGAEVETTTPDGVSPLGAAASGGHLTLAAALVRAGARADGGMTDGEGVLPWAIREGRLELAGYLLEAGADPHIRDRDGNPLLHLAMRAKQRGLSERLIRLGADPGILDALGRGPVHLAMENGWSDLIPRLTAAGADPNARNPQGLTPLLDAMARGDRELCLLLLRCGADPAREDAAGHTPLATVLAGKDATGLDVLLNHQGAGKLPAGAVSAAFPQAAAKGWREGMGLLAAAGADPDAPDAKGAAAAWQALADNDPATLGVLLRLGARKDQREPESGRLLMERAAEQGRGEIVKLLAENSAPAGAALYDACVRGDREMAGLLLDRGISDGRGGSAADTPQAAALRAGDDELALRLCEAAGNTNPELPEGQTLLHLAVLKGCHRTVKALLDGGANPDLTVTTPVSDEFMALAKSNAMRGFLRRDRDLTPLMLAAGSGSPETVCHLLAAGAKKTLRSSVNRFWPVNFAAIFGEPRIIRAMLGKDPDHEPRHFVINLSAQRVTGYDTEGKVIFQSRVSTGRKGKETRTGEFVITDKYSTWTSTIYRVPMPYFQRLNCSDFGMHQGNVPGYPASAGCIRVPAGKALELFRLTELGDRVKIVR